MATRDSINEDPGVGTDAKPVATIKMADLTHAQLVVGDFAVITVDGVALTPKYALISAAGAGDNQVIPAVGGKKLRVLSYDIMAAAAVNVKFRSGTTDKSGTYPFVANQGKVNAFNPVGWFETDIGDPLNVNLSGAFGVGGTVTYIEV